MSNMIDIQKPRNKTLQYRWLTAVMITSLISACGDSSKPKESSVNFVLSAVEGGTCSLLDPYDNMATIAGSSNTSEGIGIFEDIPADTGLVLIECSGGTYEDEATGAVLTPGTLRSYFEISSSEFTATVSPLTEIATRIIERYELAPEDYATIAENVALSFGLRNVDIAAVVPYNLNKEVMDGTESGTYGLVLAALSQLEHDIDVNNADAVIEEMVFGLASNGHFTHDEVRDLYFDALHNMFENPRIDPYLGSDEVLDIFFHDVVRAPVASQVEHVDADHPNHHNLEALSTIDAFKTSIFDIVGTHLSLKMNVTLAGEPCLVHDLQTIGNSSQNSRRNLMLAECPAQAVGEATLVVTDRGRVENITTITVVEPGTFDYTAQSGDSLTSAKSNTRSNEYRKALQTTTGTSYVFGYVSGEAPAIDASTGPAHDYSSNKVTKFNISGVTVELVDASNAVIATTTTFPDGYYEFSNAPESTSVKVLVKAEIKKVRVGSSGPEYNFSVRDNTSTALPRTMYQLATSLFTTFDEPGADNPQLDIVAKIGFNSNGQLISDAQRQSAPFAILRTMKSGADALENLNPNVSMPPLVIYWSGKNISVDGDKALGQINTSHYSGNGLGPGLYILGKADSDTDEFDQGVIGHEFGHYLQNKLSYSDSPGGSHSDFEYKDASLAYGEGYGTAIGGLLSGSQYYCDVSGASQLDGFCTDLKDKNAAGDVNGFYSESSIITLMYGIGTLPDKGLGEFFAAVTKMKSAMHSATIFSFLHTYLEANPDVISQTEVLMAEGNIKSRNPFGTLPAGTVADPAISASNNKKNATTGADDLEKLYFELALESVNAPLDSETPPLLTPNSPTFCVNRNLPGANSSNGLGMRRRFTFTANYTGDMLIRGVNEKGHTLSDQNTGFEMRDETGKAAIVFNYNGTDSDEYYGKVKINEGTKYSLKLSMYNPEAILNGSHCGFKVELARPAA